MSRLTADEEGLRKLTSVNEEVFVPRGKGHRRRNFNPYYKKKISGLKKSLENRRPC